MIYSGVNENWRRVELLHSLALAFKNAASARTIEQREIEGEVLFDCELYDSTRNESCVAGMIVVWAVITLESLANLALAETISSIEEAKEAIEFPSRYSKYREKCELTLKMKILNGDGEQFLELRDIANSLSEMRNAIVHDKPLHYTDYGDGDVNILHIRSRGAQAKTLSYSDLEEIFGMCDRVRHFLLDTFDSDHLNVYGRSFSGLVPSDQKVGFGS
jgi:hypothetical protein